MHTADLSHFTHLKRPVLASRDVLGPIDGLASISLPMTSTGIHISAIHVYWNNWCARRNTSYDCQYLYQSCSVYQYGICTHAGFTTALQCGIYGAIRVIIFWFPTRFSSTRDSYDIVSLLTLSHTNYRYIKDHNASSSDS
jgi:hypothetical protein